MTSTPMVEFPRRLRILFRTTALTHDLAIILMGVFALQESPKTILLALPKDYNLYWASLLILGGVISAIGVFFRNIRAETTGCAVVVGAKLVWVIAALTPQVEVFGTEVLAMGLIAGATGTCWRILGLFASSYLRGRD